jgi:hypothetical protein
MTATTPPATETAIIKRASPEVELLLLCARASVGDEERRRIVELAASVVEWDAVLRLAGRHGLVPPLFMRVSEFCADAAPADALASLRDQFRRVSALNVYLSDELRQLLRLFAACGVEAMPYKGPALAVAAYGNVALRQFCDLDIIVRARSLDAAKEVLVERGYQPYGGLDDAQQSVVQRTQCNLAFTCDDDRTIVELHWEVAARGFSPALAAEELWARSGVAEFEGESVRALAPEDLLLALCIHGTKHVWERLGWLCDIARLVESSDELDWDALRQRAHEGGCSRMLALALALARDLLGARLPEEATMLIEQDAASRELCRIVASRLLSDADMQPGVRAYFRFQVAARERWRDRIRYCRYALSPTERDLAALRLPRSLSLIYYFLRPLRLAWTGGPPHLRAGKK